MKKWQSSYPGQEPLCIEENLGYKVEAFRSGGAAAALRRRGPCLWQNGLELPGPAKQRCVVGHLQKAASWHALGCSSEPAGQEEGL